MKKMLQILMCVVAFSFSSQLYAQNWELVWSEEFNYTGFPDASKWSFVDWAPGNVNNELQRYVPNRWENARVENGALVIEAHRDWHNGSEYSSARIHSSGKASWTYGRIEARIKLPGGWGTWPAFWMMPEDPTRFGFNEEEGWYWPNCGEIDIVEYVGHDPGWVHGSVHSLWYNFKYNTQRTGKTYVGNAESAFNLYAIEWFPDRIDYFVNNQKYYTVYNDYAGWQSWPFDDDFHIILNLAVGGVWGGSQGVDPNIWPRRMEVDYVRVYKSVQSQTPIGQTVWMRGSNNQYVSSENGVSPMICNRNSVQGWELFTIVDAGNGRVALQGSNGNFVSSENGQSPMICNRPAIQGWETFEWINNSNGTFSLRGNNGMFVSSENGVSAMICNRPSIGLWEEFAWGYAGQLRSASLDEAGQSGFGEMALEVSPNPVSNNELTIDIAGIDADEEVQISLTAINGQKILSDTVYGSTNRISLPGTTANGMYVLQVVTKQQSFTEKIVVK